MGAETGTEVVAETVVAVAVAAAVDVAEIVALAAVAAAAVEMVAPAVAAIATISLALKAARTNLAKREKVVTSSRAANVPATRGHVTRTANNVGKGVGRSLMVGISRTKILQSLARSPRLKKRSSLAVSRLERFFYGVNLLPLGMLGVL